MIRAHIDKVAEEHHITLTDLKWYGAFHNESHHPHVHLLLYSTAEKDNAYLTKTGIDNLRRLFGTEVFKDDLREIYDEQTEVRNRLTAEMRLQFKKLVEAVKKGDFINYNLLAKIEELARRLSACTGKKQYGYLPKGIKALVDEIVDDVSKDERIDKLYDLWYQAKCSVVATYSDTSPEKLPLSKEKTFKAIRNALVYEATSVGELIKSYENAEKKYSQRSPKPNSSGQKTKAENGNYYSRYKASVTEAALRFGRCVARVFDDDFHRYYSDDEDDIDKQLRWEIQAVKNGQNLVM